ncbi:MAG TPA: NAD(P)H-hydrate dehydratase, partial [Mycobacteriales bacterium]|nr:NAD(P)H-hydrate dehydratase [Mycobacteriales bacterium]
RAGLAAVLAAGGRVAAEPPAEAALVLDGMTGAGAAGPLRARAADLAQAVRGQLTVAVDLPSGVDCDTGAVLGDAVRADLTVTFDALKPAHLVGDGAHLCGVVHVADIGLGLAHSPGPLGALTADDVARLLLVPGEHEDKYSRGVVGLVTGSPRYPGAAVLSVGGAVRAGAGYVRYAGPSVAAIHQHWPSVVVGDGRVDAVVVGCGLGTDEQTLDRVRTALAADLPTIVDADALAAGRDALRGRHAPTLITPHLGEFQRLTGVDPRSNPLACARRAASELEVTVLLKGQHTVIAAPDGRARINTTGSTWLSTAGTGDVLAGAAGALMAAFAKHGMPAEDIALEAGSAAAFLHGLAGHRAASGAPFPAEALLDVWPDVVRDVRGSR